jgi:hypothetical protein
LAAPNRNRQLQIGPDSSSRRSSATPDSSRSAISSGAICTYLDLSGPICTENAFSPGSRPRRSVIRSLLVLWSLVLRYGRTDGRTDAWTLDPGLPEGISVPPRFLRDFLSRIGPLIQLILPKTSHSFPRFPTLGPLFPSFSHLFPRFPTISR